MAAPDRGRCGPPPARVSCGSPRHASLPAPARRSTSSEAGAGGVPRSRGGARPAGRLRRTVGGRRRRAADRLALDAAANRSGALAGRRGLAARARSSAARPPSWRRGRRRGTARRPMSTPHPLCRRTTSRTWPGRSGGSPSSAPASSTCSRHRSRPRGAASRSRHTASPPARRAERGPALAWRTARRAVGVRRPSAGASLLRPRPVVVGRGRPRRGAAPRPGLTLCGHRRGPGVDATFRTVSANRRPGERDRRPVTPRAGPAEGPEEIVPALLRPGDARRRRAVGVVEVHPPW